tara:strand:- start:5106 stop:6599 length:1494 start_codon:yes stop_codon:yes gene_type:complete
MDTVAGKFEANRQKIGAALTAIGAVGVVAGKKFVGAALEQQRAEETLAAVVENTGESWDEHRQKILDTTSALQDKTNFGDEEQLRVLAKMLPAIGNVDQALDALPAVLDAASSSGLDVASVGGTLSRALAGMTDTSESTGLTFDKTADFSERLAEVFGVVEGAAEANADPMTQLGNTMGDVSESIGAALLPTLIPLVEKLGEIAVKVQDWMKENEGLIKVLAPILIAVVGIAVVLGPILILLPLLSSGIGILTGAFVFLNLSMAPVLIAVAAIALAIGAGIVIWKNWDNIMSVIRVSFEKVKAVFGNVVRVMETLYRSKLGWILPGGPLIKAILFLKDNWDTVWDGMVAVVQVAWDSIKSIVSGVIGAVMKPVDLLFDAITKIIEGIGKIAGLVSKIPGGGVVGDVAGKVFGGLKSFAGFAEGGIVRRPTLGLVGESGPEAVIPLNRAGGGGLGGVTVVVNMPRSGTVIFDNERTARALGTEITRQVRTVLRSQRAF